jgi:hypothetical protein
MRAGRYEQLIRISAGAPMPASDAVTAPRISTYILALPGTVVRLFRAETAAADGHWNPCTWKEYLIAESFSAFAQARDPQSPADRVPVIAAIRRRAIPARAPSKLNPRGRRRRNSGNAFRHGWCRITEQ